MNFRLTVLHCTSTFDDESVVTGAEAYWCRGHYDRFDVSKKFDCRPDAVLHVFIEDPKQRNDAPCEWFLGHVKGSVPATILWRDHLSAASRALFDAQARKVT